jgi:hypothetical protein
MDAISITTPNASDAYAFRRSLIRGDRPATYRVSMINKAAESGDLQMLLDAIQERVYWHDSCWLWMGSMTSSGRPYLTVLHKRTNLRRLVLQCVGRPCDKDQIAVVTCENKTCVNPEHLDISQRA